MLHCALLRADKMANGRDIQVLFGSQPLNPLQAFDLPRRICSVAASRSGRADQFRVLPYSQRRMADVRNSRGFGDREPQAPVWGYFPGRLVLAHDWPLSINRVSSGVIQKVSRVHQKIYVDNLTVKVDTWCVFFYACS